MLLCRGLKLITCGYSVNLQQSTARFVRNTPVLLQLDQRVDVPTRVKSSSLGPRAPTCRILLSHFGQRGSEERLTHPHANPLLQPTALARFGPKLATLKGCLHCVARSPVLNLRYKELKNISTHAALMATLRKPHPWREWRRTSLPPTCFCTRTATPLPWRFGQALSDAPGPERHVLVFEPIGTLPFA